MISIFSLIEQSFLYLPLMLGAFISLSLMKLPNLSLEAAFVTGAVFAGKLLPLFKSLHPLLALLCVICFAAAGGALVGICVSQLVIRGKIPMLLANVMAISIFFGFNLFLLSSAQMTLTGLINPLFDGFITKYPECVSIACVSIFLFITMTFILVRQIGYSFAIYGQNPLFFKNYMIDAEYVLTIGLALSNALAGISGYLISQTAGFVDVNCGTGIALLCITTLILGKLFAAKVGPNNVLQPFIGVFCYNLLQQLLLNIGFNLKYFMVVQAITVLCIMICHRLYYKTNEDSLSIDSLGV